jgi:hypothetical protein
MGPPQYIKEKRIEILGIIDPLPELGSDDNELSSPNKEIEVATSHKRDNNDNGRRYRAGLGKVALMMSVFVLVSVSIFSTIISTEDVYQNTYSHLIGLSGNTTENYGVHNPQYLKTYNDISYQVQDTIHNCAHT